MLPRLLPFAVATFLAAAPLLDAQGSNGASAAVPRRGDPSPFHPDRLERIDAFVKQQIADGRIPGAVVMLVRDGRVAYHKAYGVRDLGTRAPQRVDDIFRIASQTKAITSTAVMMLWEEGRFLLDDPIEKYIPSFADQRVLTKFNEGDSTYESRPAKRKTTIRQLLTHTSGLDYADIGSDAFRAIYAKAGITGLGRPGDVLGERIDVLARLPLHADPGERFIYSLSTDVLGRLVEVVSGQSLDEFFRTRIFVPLRMNDTYFGVPAAKRDRLVALHQPVEGQLMAAHEATGALAHPDWPLRGPTYFSGGGGLSSTTSDYARFLQMYLNGGELDGVRLLGRKTIEMILTNQVAPLQPAFGLGFALETEGTDFRQPESVGSFEWGGAFKTTYWADRKERLVGLIFTNVWGVDVELGAPFKAMVYAALR